MKSVIATAAAPEISLDLVDVVDMEPVQGEYVNCKVVSDFDVFGVHVEQAFHYCHAEKLAIRRRWNSSCEKCSHRLRYCFILGNDETGEYHCFGRDCFNVETLGTAGARRLRYFDAISESDRGGFKATFAVPPKFWDIPRETRPAWARVWKGEERGRGRSAMMNRGRPKWMLTIWGDVREECLARCLELDALLDVRLF